ncbi:MAG: hypothetical protein E7131_03600 [Rikenellaceae bacterium]|nr:hypothetical protein [Rikenellaceae bacterium]
MKYLLPILSLIIVVSCGPESTLRYRAKIRAEYREQYQEQMQTYLAKNAERITDSIMRRNYYKVDSLEEVLQYYKLVASQKEFASSPQDSLIRIVFTNPIAGYQVSAFWQPEYVGYMNRIIGKAILNFRSKNDSFSIVHSMFFLPGNIGLDSDNKKFDPSYLYELEYPNAELKNLREDDLPFFFLNNRKYLVLTMWAQGQRRTHAYQFLVREGGCDLNYEQGALYQITHQEPFNEIDMWSYIGEDEIITIGIGGAEDDTRKYYRKNEYGNGYTLYKIEEREGSVVRTYKPKNVLVNKSSVNESAYDKHFDNDDSANDKPASKREKSETPNAEQKEYVIAEGDKPWVESLNRVAKSEGLYLDKNHKVYFKYDHLLEGYEITMLWLQYDDEASASGGVLIHFNNKSLGKKFYVLQEEYFSNITMCDLIYGEGVTTHPNNAVYHIDYKFESDDKQQFLSNHDPFQFVDIDFDGKDELIVDNFYNPSDDSSQRWVYDITSIGLELKEYLPFSHMDSENIKVDFNRKSITLKCGNRADDADRIVFAKSHNITSFYYPDSLSHTPAGKLIRHYNTEEKMDMVIDSAYIHFYGKEIILY